MQLDTFLNALARRNAQQAVLVSGQPMRVLIDGSWNPGAATPTDALLDAMLQSAAPGQNTSENRFETRAGAEKFAVRITARNSARIIVLTRLDASGTPLAPEESAISAFAPQSVPAKPDDFDRARIAAPLASQKPLARSETPRATPPLAPTPAFDPLALPALVPMAPPIASPLATTPPPLPNAVTGEWYHAARGQKVGPISGETMQGLIKTNVVRPDTMVWQEGMSDWAMAKLTELSRQLEMLPPPIRENGWNGGGYGTTNSSGTGWEAIVPKEVSGRINIGALFIPGFWACSQGLWGLGVPFIILGALVGVGIVPWWLVFIGQLVLSINGNKLAWKFRPFRDLDEYNAVQRAWGWAGFAFFIFYFLIGFVPAFLAAANAPANFN